MPFITLKRTVVVALLVSTLFGAGLVLHRARSGPPPQVDMVVDAATRAQLLDDIIAQLRRAYVLPDLVPRMEQSLRAHRAELDSISSAVQLASTLTALLRAAADDDQHLDVVYSEQPLPEPTTDDAPSPEEAANLRKRTLRKNAGFESVQRLRGNIGYLELTKFFRPEHVAPRMPAAMQLLTDTAALIIDLRDCDGGDPETVMLVASYFFDSKTHLNDVYWRDENRTEERFTNPDVAGLHYGEARKIVLLVGEETASGCEDFAYALKNAKRATVVGEKTAGAAHAGSRQRLNAHFMMFVPSGRPISPVTQTDWEHVGVVPDVKVSARKALVTAHVELMKGLIAVERDPEWKGKLEHMLADLE